MRRIPGKLVFILDGGANGIVVVKFETVGRATESVARFADRQTALRAIAAQVLQNVPGASSLDAADMGAIAQINAAGGADLADLKMMADGVLNTRQGFDRLLALKMENINVGQNLEDMVKAAAQAAAAAPAPALVAGAGGRVRAPAPVQGPAPIVRHDSPLWQEFGKMAAFDMLVSNNDRFRPEGVNLQNVDLHGTQGVSLDVVDPNTPLRTPDTWEGEAIFGAPTTWALNTVGGMCDTLGVNRLYLQTVSTRS